MSQYILGSSGAYEVNWMFTIIPGSRPVRDEILRGNLLVESIERCRKSAAASRTSSEFCMEHRVLTVLRLFAGQVTVAQPSSAGLCGI